MYQKSTLDNGLRVLTSTMPYTRSVTVSFFIGAGSRYEKDSQAGVSHFVEHLCFRGTARRPTAKDISTAIEGVGGIINGGTDKELTVYWCKVASPHLEIAFDVLIDMLMNSRFSPQDIEKERQVIIEEINMSNDSPSQRVGMLIDETLWPGHPLGRDIAGSRDSVSSINRELMFHYLGEFYQPGNCAVAAAGNIQHDKMVNLVNQALGKWTARRTETGYLAYKESRFPRLRIEKRDLEQVHLCLALPGLSLLHPKRFAVDLLNIILGDGMSSRLFTNIRDKLGLAYHISSYVDHFLDTGALIIAAGVEARNLNLAIKAITEELAHLKEAVPETELNKAKEFSKGRLLLRMEDSRSVAGWIGGQELLTKRILTVDDVVSIIDGITAVELQKLAEELLLGDKLRLAIVGPVSPDAPLDELLKL